MTLFPAAKDDFTAENGVTYTWEDNRWRTKSFLMADGGVVDVGPAPPLEAGEGDLWYDSTRLELFVYYVDDDGNGAWVASSPLGARVEQGEAVQQEILGRLTQGEEKQELIIQNIGAIQTGYVKKDGDTMTGALQVTRPGITAAGQYVFSAKAEGLPSDKSVAFRVTADGGVKAGHDTGTAFIAKANNDVVTKKFVDTNLVPSSGGTFTGQLTVKYSGGDVPRFVVSNGDFHSFFVQTNHMAHCRGRVYVNSYMEDGGGQTADANKLATINEVKEIAAESGGGGKFIDNFDRGYTTVQGSQTAPISFNTIALLDSDGLATKNFANISQVLMSWDQMNPEYITKTGHIKLTDEGNDILRGYLTVLDYKVSDGRNVAFQVMPGKYGGNTSEIGYGKRLSLTFNGALFGTYDALWSPS